MPSRIASIFGAYDLFAKAIPGTAFFIGLISLLDEWPIPSTVKGTLAVITLAILVTLVLGFMFGQAVHSFAVAIENNIYSSGKFFYDNITFVRPEYWRPFKSDSEKEANKIAPRSVRMVRSIQGWIGRRYIYFIHWNFVLLAPHRRLFEQKLTNQLSNNQDRSKITENVLTHFCDVVDLDDLDNMTDVNDVYRISMSHLESFGAGRARQFQAISSFSRSTWITMMFFSIVYSLVYVVQENTSYLSEYSPLVESLLQGVWSYPILIIVIVLSSILFMISERQYKSHFVQYILVDFYTSTRNLTSSE